MQKLLLDRDPTHWDRLLPQVIRALRSVAPEKDEEMINAYMLGREVRLPQALKGPLSTDDQSTDKMVVQNEKRMKVANQIIKTRKLI